MCKNKIFSVNNLIENLVNENYLKYFVRLCQPNEKHTSVWLKVRCIISSEICEISFLFFSCTTLCTQQTDVRGRYTFYSFRNLLVEHTYLHHKILWRVNCRENSYYSLRKWSRQVEKEELLAHLLGIDFSLEMLQDFTSSTENHQVLINRSSIKFIGKCFGNVPVSTKGLSRVWTWIEILQLVWEKVLALHR